MTHRRLVGCSVGALVLAGCMGQIGGSSAESAGDDPSSPGAGAATGNATGPGQAAPAGAGGVAGAAATPGAGGGVLAERCEPRVYAAPAPLQRLTAREYQQTVRDLFPGVTLPALATLPDADAGGFDNLAPAQPVGAALVEALLANARTVATAALSQRTRWFPCASITDEAACGRTLVTQFGRRAYRRPLAADEQTRYEALFAQARATYGFDAALRVVVQSFLQSPGFLYRAELGRADPARPGVLRLSTYELASRLSYFLWDTMPDDALFAAAENSTLDTPAALEAQARRLLADARARATVAHFQDQWLELGAISGLRKDKAVFAGFDDPMTQTLRQATARFAEHAFWTLGGLGDLLTAPQAFVNSRSAPLYGLTAAQTDLKVTDLPGNQRAGILTQAGLMAALASDTASAPVRRGVFVLERFLCARPPAPPPDAMSLPPAQTASVVTTRDRFEKAHTGAGCVACHRQIDGLGFGFEHYDAVGRWRDRDNGAPVNATGRIIGVGGDVDGDFDGAIELARKLAGSAKVRDCVASSWVAYAAGSPQPDVGACTLQPIVERFQRARLDLRELLVAIATSDAFRHRPTFTP